MIEEGEGVTLDHSDTESSEVVLNCQVERDLRARLGVLGDHAPPNESLQFRLIAYERGRVTARQRPKDVTK